MGKKVSAGQRGSIRSWQLEWQGGGQLVTFNRLGKVLQTGSAFHLLCSTGWSLTVVLWVANTPSWSMDLAEVNEELSGLCIRKHSRLAGRARRLCPGPEGARTSTSCQDPANLAVTLEPASAQVAYPKPFSQFPSPPALLISSPVLCGQTQTRGPERGADGTQPRAQ